LSIGYLVDEKSGRWARCPVRGWIHYFSEASEIAVEGHKVVAARFDELETRERDKCDNQREVEIVSHVFSILRRAKDVPALLSAMEELLRQQHAVCEPDRPQGLGFPNRAVVPAKDAEFETPAWLRSKTSRAWRLLLSAVREFLDAATKEELQPEDLWIHTSYCRQPNRTTHSCDEREGRVDTMERRRWGDVCEHKT